MGAAETLMFEPDIRYDEQSLVRRHSQTAASWQSDSGGLRSIPLDQPRIRCDLVLAVDGDTEGVGRALDDVGVEQVRPGVIAEGKAPGVRA